MRKKRDAAVAAPEETEWEPIEFEIVEQVPVSTCQTRLVISIPNRAVEETYSQLLEELGREVQWPGFRKGKVPRRLLEERIGTRLRAETRDSCVERAKHFAVESLHLVPIAEIEETRRDNETETEPLRFTAVVEHRPHIQLADYRSMSVPLEPEPITEAKVIERIDEYRERAAVIAPVEDRAARRGDLARVTITASVNLRPWERGCIEDAEIEIEPDDALPGLADGLVGLLPGTTSVHEVRVPKEHENAELAGNTILYRITLKGLREKRLPDLDDAFAREVLGFDSLSELKEHIRSRLTAEALEQAEEQRRDRILEKLLAMHSVDPPPTMVERRLRLLEMYHEDLLQDRVDAEMLAKLRQTREWNETLREHAVFRVKASLVLTAIADAEGIEMPDEVLAARLAQVAARSKHTPSEYVALLKEQGILEYYRQLELERAVLDWLVNHMSTATAPAPAHSDDAGTFSSVESTATSESATAGPAAGGEQPETERADT